MELHTIDFNLDKTLESGQSFRFKKQDGIYTILVGNRVFTVAQDEHSLWIDGTDDEPWIRNYFDLDRDYDSILTDLRNDSVLAEAILDCFGIRILNQPLFECTISFILSQQNSIPRIMKLINALCVAYGSRVGPNSLFPTVEQLKRATDTDLRKLGIGFRAPYIVDAVKRWDNIEKADLPSRPLGDVIGFLTQINGIGPKIAQCVALFSCDKIGAFPVDVWIKRAVEHFYLDDRIVSADYVQRFAQEKFGEFAGIAQQYLYVYARKYL